ncbi:RagB/SusD family nutrient uptake outer membrane protein [Pedobacter glucosidilyticus]|uniref:RagB/SusD family nutrient uptake outer membrane protein n=1 Tax=Pedobacter glucosidilyticus TaxID=1122941 RepID=UPI00138B0C5A|nr:RagB/SusD family nutrient uptake outer membrane protein [Pedobacter glucosidilyticus]
MMNIKIFKQRFSVATVMLLWILTACQDFLEVKPNQQLVIPQKLNDLQALLDETFINTVPAIAEGAADNYFLTDADFNSFPFERERNIYLWRNTADDGDAGNWQRMYSTILACNVVLETLEANNYSDNQNVASQLKGQALFHRANNFFNLLMIFAPAYQEATAATDLGIPLRLSSDFNQVNGRNSLAACYDKIITDLQEASKLLEPRGIVATRPDRCNTYALLSRVALYKQDYAMVKAYADSALAINNNLIDYNSLSTSSNIPFVRLNAETLFYATGVYTILAPSRCRISPELYQQYEAQDLRKQLFFRANADGTFQFKGNYSGQNGSSMFTGITTAEVLLNRAEALARQNETTLAMADLNTLLLKRFRNGSYTPMVVSNHAVALEVILRERRKELIFRGLRWYDLKRLNLSAATSTTLSRTVAGQTYSLLPNSNAYVFPIPSDVIERGGLEQNPR